MSDDTDKSKALMWIVALVVTVVMGWTLKSGLDSNKETQDAVKVIKPQVDQNTARIEKVELWQDEWPTKGELAADVRQTKDIEYLKQTDARLREALRIVDERIRELEIEAAAQRQP